MEETLRDRQPVIGDDKRQSGSVLASVLPEVSNYSNCLWLHLQQLSISPFLQFSYEADAEADDKHA